MWLDGAFYLYRNSVTFVYYEELFKFPLDIENIRDHWSAKIVSTLHKVYAYNGKITLAIPSNILSFVRSISFY